jgi:predicted ATPase
MLTRLDLKYFKCFELLHLPLAHLTLLSGTNASGKSSILQALVLIHQTMLEHEWSKRLMLNGDSIKLGTVSDVVDKINGRTTFEIGVIDNEQKYLWAFDGERSEMSMAVDSVSVDQVSNKQPDLLRFLLPPNVSDKSSLANRLRGLTYITAERIGPREVYPLEDRQIASVVGPAGEHAVSVLHWGRDESVLPELVMQGVINKRLHQVEARMRMFFPGCGLEVQQVSQVNAVTLGLRTSDATDFHRPINVGFGLTQVLPIVIAALSAAKEDILLIENPEVHLHPAGQALMGQFLAEVASAGVQVIVETHSDHVLNGIRRFVKSGQILPEQLAIHFFRPNSSDMAQVVSPQIDATGNIDTWPDGFFDQFDKDMNHFAGWD